MTDLSEKRGCDVRRTGQWRALALLAATLVLCMSTWFSVSAVIPRLRAREQSPSTISSILSGATWTLSIRTIIFMTSHLDTSLASQESRSDVHHGALRCLLGLFDAAATGIADWSEFDAEAERLSIEEHRG